LYDAWSTDAWDTRAQIVSSADPTALIDGDGWDVPPQGALEHAVSSTVYGVPAMYFGDRWGDGTPVRAPTAAVLGAVMSLAADKGPGEARRLADGEWALMGGGRVIAQTFGGVRDLVVWTPAGLGLVVATDGSPATLPVASGGRAQLTDPSHRPVRTTPTAGGVEVSLVPGVRYTIVVGGPAKAPGT
jgi:hypothetical protein